MQITKAEAAKRFGISERAIERAVAAGQLHPQEERKPGGGSIKYYDLAELDAWHEGRRTKVDRTNEPAPTDTATVALVAVSELARIVATIPETLARALPPAPEQSDRRGDSRIVGVSVVDLAHKLTLSLDEASQLSGLSRGLLRRAIRDGALQARKLGRGWRIKRSDLEDYVRGL